MEYIVIVLLLAGLMGFAAKYYLLRKMVVSVSRQMDEENIRLLTVGFVDGEFSALVQKINGLLDKIQQSTARERLSAAALKSSIANISHDMKTPLTSVTGYLQLAERECPEENIREMLQICLERTKYCNTLINDFFELSLVETQGCQPDMVCFDAAEELCGQILGNVPLFEEKGIVPHFENSDELVMVCADKIMFRRIVQNLISNSIKYTCGDIWFCLTEGESVVLAVSNPAAGEIETEHIFDKFYTQDKARHSGHGIGLYLCREFAEAMGGSIRAEMEGGILSILWEMKKGGSEGEAG